MAENSAIAWTDHTFNPWWGCTKVSPGCDNCYAAALADRVGQNGLWGLRANRRLIKNWKEPERWNREARKEGRIQGVFCASMADVFEEREDLDRPRERLWTLIHNTPFLVWLLLTKRPHAIKRHVDKIPPNVWLGASVENQLLADKRIPELMRYAVRDGQNDRIFPIFLSVEPMLGPVQLQQEWSDQIRWVIVGGESGPRCRDMMAAWARDMQQWCEQEQIPFFFKQAGGRGADHGGDKLFGVRYQERPWEGKL